MKLNTTKQYFVTAKSFLPSLASKWCDGAMNLAGAPAQTGQWLLLTGQPHFSVLQWKP